eukprot:TRINITY_DN2948_c0_g1_i1.p1 TRINITY_DN2948_c0_g1~~TRINITY_DN2948_c0_g1_i1.p1  ORF type:complete len:270 (-),score=-7.28 TRINITY_DN2948_c0_g1_i1:43-852(-)
MEFSKHITFIVLLTFLFTCQVFAGVQFTPTRSNWTYINNIVKSASGFMGHAPNNAPTWVKSEGLKSTWDGKTIFYNTSWTGVEMRKALCASTRMLRGFYQMMVPNPCAINNATISLAQIDCAYNKTFAHFRKLIGNTVPVTLDTCLTSRTLWANQYKYTAMWSNYSVTTCQASAHCGATFIPSNVNDQKWFGSPTLVAPCVAGVTSESAQGLKADYPWFMKLSAAFCELFQMGGPNDPHVGFLRTHKKYGVNIFPTGPGSTFLRMKGSS